MTEEEWLYKCKIHTFQKLAKLVNTAEKLVKLSLEVVKRRSDAPEQTHWCLEIEEHSTTKLKHPKLKCLNNGSILKTQGNPNCINSGKDSFMSLFLWLWFLYPFFDLDNISKDRFWEESQSIMHEKPDMNIPI